MQSQFGPYRVEGLIARGGMGEILRAYDTRHDRIVALKLLAPHLAADQEFRERFKREAHAAGRLNEPHVIPIHGYGEIDGRLYLDMRLVEGEDLGARLNTHGPMHPHDVVHVVEQVAQALDAAHAARVVHRDVKPSNVLLGAGGFAYLVDFGIAASIQDATSRTSGSVTMGTLAYMAPERFGDAPSDHRADVYSLACVLYQCLTGAKPYGVTSTEALIYAHLNREPPKPSETGLGVPPDFDRVVATGMAKNPAGRYATAGELAAAARRALRATAPLGAAGAVPERRRSRWPIVLTAVGAVAAVAGITAAVVTLQPATGGQATPVPRPTPTAVETPATSAPVTSSAAPTSAAPVTEEPPSAAPVPPPPSVPPTTTTSRPPYQAKVCKTVSYKGEERGTGCFDADGDLIAAKDTNKDGFWIKTRSETDYHHTAECRDTSSEGDYVKCTLQLKPEGTLRIAVELWDGQKKLSSTSWSGYTPIGK
ncbi:serine/threonine protein kinase [Saccharopolyspora rhizosphaerae]|uniref:non-specific serine/threonine protein kinase n=1 Tax=Saccharopolyspora rhizosphaerae TaxID=2492662 RepID=A0A3R8P8B5_9PSEU|nr:serine/threonine-protein kinase [Saccharopolyspora rhizosphaerae]RRO18901.1 serine/threonine protein kinase [Saccharopolyspora rhizosphaerae]